MKYLSIVLLLMYSNCFAEAHYNVYCGAVLGGTTYENVTNLQINGKVFTFKDSDGKFHAIYDNDLGCSADEI